MIVDAFCSKFNMLFNKETKFVLIEKKTDKRREVKINRVFQKHIKDYYQAWHVDNMKELKYRYGLKIEHFSTLSLRKTFGTKVFESSDNAELDLGKLM